MKILARYITDKHEYGFAKVRAHNHSSLLNDIADEVNTKGHGLLDVWIQVLAHQGQRQFAVLWRNH
jgi:hypothetical protein